MLTAILLTAAASSLLWWRTAENTSRQLASTINEQIVAAVRKEVSAIVGEAAAAHTAIRTLFLQNVLDTREADKREFVFLSQLQSHATISWAAFGWPDGSFFAAHKLGDEHLEMMEISLTDHPGQRRIDEYAVIPGDIEFDQRQFVPTDFRIVDQAWFKTGTGLGVENPRLAVADFAPRADTAKNHSALFTQVVRDDLQFSGILDFVSPSFYPPQPPSQPSELRNISWTDPPANANLVAFGNLTESTPEVAIQAWLFDVRNPSAQPVVAKVYRDGRMCQLDREYPQYGLASHKGYSTPEHKQALLAHGPSPLHRRSFRPVAENCLPWD